MDDILTSSKTLEDDFKKFSKKVFSISLDDIKISTLFSHYAYAATNKLKIENKIPEYFILRGFIESLYSNEEKNKKDIEIFESLMEYYQIEDLNLLDTRNKKILSKSNIFLDAQIILKILGYYGSGLKSIYETILKKLNEMKVNLYVFSNTFEKLWMIIFSYKRCIAQNIMEEKGLNTFLKVKKESGLHYNQLLEKDILKENIEKLGINFIESYIIDNDYSNDKNILNLINEIKSKKNVEELKDFSKKECFFLTNDHKNQEFTKSPNIIFENTLIYYFSCIFNDCKDLNKQFLKQQALKLYVTNENFKYLLYCEARRVEIFKDINIQNLFTENPFLEDELYQKAIIKNAYENKDFVKKLLASKYEH